MEKKIYKIVFFGSDSICLPCLRYLQKKPLQDSTINWELFCIVSQPDKKKGRGQNLQSNPVAEFAKANGIALIQPEKPDLNLVNWMKDKKLDICLVMAYGHFLGKSLRDVFPCGIYNFHASELPFFRGASPIETALALGAKHTKISFMKIEKKMDGGKISDTQNITIDVNDTALSLRIKIAESVVPLVDRVLPKIIDDTLSWRVQNEKEATYCRKLTKQDGSLDFSLTAEEIYNRWRAFYSWPSTYFYHNKQRIKVGKLRIYVESDLEKIASKPGVVCRLHNDSFIVATGNGFIEILELQRPGGKMLKTADFLRGYKLSKGDLLTGCKNSKLLL